MDSSKEFEQFEELVHNSHTDDLDFGVWDVAKSNRVEGDSNADS